jgi:dihydrodipicolinate synthase/N-acetylneuraminate lyase
VQHLADAIFAPPVADYRARLKTALAMLGVIEDDSVRPPLLPLSDAQRRTLRAALANAGLSVALHTS